MRFHLPFAVALLVASESPVAAQAQCPQWTAGFEIPGVNDDVYAFAYFDDGSGPAFYVAGDFTRAAGVPVNRIARWDGATWTNAGAGLTFATNRGINALAVFDDGAGPKLYAGGAILGPTYGIARYDGTSWSGVGGGLGYFTFSAGEAYALAVHDDGSGPQLFVGGRFDNAGGVVARSIAKWRGMTWSALGPGLDAQPPDNGAGSCTSLEVHDDGTGPALYVGGRFVVSGVSGSTSLARWNGTSWSSVGNDPVPANKVVTSLSSYDDGSGRALYVAGNFANLDGVTTNGGLGRWNGSSWSAVGGGVAQSVGTTIVSALEVVDLGHGPALYVGGVFDHAGGLPANAVARWNGAWSALSSGLSTGGTVIRVRAFGAYDDGSGAKLFAGGGFDRAGDRGAYCVAAWDEVEWSPVSEGEGTLGYVTALLSTDSGPDGAALYAGGFFNTLGSAASPNIARWDGTRWHALDYGVLGDEVDALALYDDGSGTALYAGGLFTFVASGPANAIARWDGAHWSALGSGVNGHVNSLCAFNGELYAGGDFSNAGGVAASNIARWNGSSWSAVAGGTTSVGPDSVDALCVFDDGSGPALYVAGQFSSAGGGVAGTQNIARWNGTNWLPVGASGASSRIGALLVHDDGTGAALYAGGTFATIGGVAASRIAKWNGAGWSQVGGGTTARIYALTSFAVQPGAAPELFAAGDLGSYSGSPATRIARWNGSAWQGLGNVNDLVFALASFDDPTTPWRELYLGGLFSLANGVSSQSVARWTNPCAYDATSYCTAGTTSSGCVPSISGIGTPSASASSGFTIRIDDVEGQRQGLIFYGASGAIAMPWSPLSSSYLCIKAPTQRTPLQISSGASGACDGVIQIDWLDYVATHPASLGAPFSAGAQVWAQLYFRDPPAPKTTNLSNGLTFILAP